MAELDIFLAACRAFTDRVHAITEDQWQDETPDDDWTVAKLVEHLIDEHLWGPPLLHGLDLKAAQGVVDGARKLPVDGGVGANLAEAWDEACTACVDAFTEADALERTVNLSRGPTPARDYLNEMIFDVVVHAWDLGVAIDYPDPIQDELAEPVYQAVLQYGDLAATGMFKRPVDVPDDASTLDKLVALTGRTPR